MLFQRPYRHPYIPKSTKWAPVPPYVGGELQSLTTNTPFFRGEGVPIYPMAPAPHRVTRLAGVNYGSPVTLGLSSGAKGESVRALQNLLISKGYSVGTYGADADFGSDTLTALKNFQKANTLAQTGTVDQATLNALTGVPSTQTAETSQNGKKGQRLSIVQSILEGIGASLGTQPPPPAAAGVTIHQYQPKEMSMGMKAGLGLGVFVVSGTLVYLLVSKEK